VQKAALSAICEFDHHQILRMRRKSGLAGRIAATVVCDQCLLLAVHCRTLVCLKRCCAASDDREEPTLTDAALCLNVGDVCKAGIAVPMVRLISVNRELF